MWLVAGHAVLLHPGHAEGANPGPGAVPADGGQLRNPRHGRELRHPRQPLPHPAGHGPGAY